MCLKTPMVCSIRYMSYVNGLVVIAKYNNNKYKLGQRVGVWVGTETLYQTHFTTHIRN